MKLNLKNPIVFFDLETTGTNINTDRIVEISYIKVHPNGNEESKTLRINPEMPIPNESSLIHGIYDADVAGRFKQLFEEDMKHSKLVNEEAKMYQPSFLVRLLESLMRLISPLM